MNSQNKIRYRSIRVCCWLTAAALLLPASTSKSAEGVLSYVSFDGGGFVVGTAGWTFKPLTPISVTSLGCFDYILNGANPQTPMSIGLWADNGSLLAWRSVTSTDLLVNQTRYAPITPVSLTPGLTYHIGGYNPNQRRGTHWRAPSGARSFFAATPTDGGSVSTSPEIQLGTAAVNFSGFASPTSASAPAWGPGAAYLLPNFLYTVPEPCSVALLFLGGLVAAWRRTRSLASQSPLPPGR